jgi:hypothetical protein
MSSGSLSAAGHHERGGGWALRPGPRSTVAAAAVAAIAVAALLLLTLTSGGAHRATRPAKVSAYGHLPGWLPKITNNVKVEVAKPGSPILSEEQGYTVRAELARGGTEVTAAGPQIPAYVSNDVQRDAWPDSKPVPGTFIVTLADVRGTVPLSPTAFSILTDDGTIVHPEVAVRGGGALPAALHSGQRINLDVTGNVTEGSGSIRWAPLGKRVLVGWIYQLELD